MALVVEDGSGVTGANAYVSVQEADDYYAIHLYGTTWTSASMTTARKEAAIVMATRMIDASFSFKGNQYSVSQALKWPRYGVRLPSDPAAGQAYQPDAENQSPDYYNTLPSNMIPQALKNAVMELCRFLLAKDRSTDQDKSNIKRQKVDVIEREFFEGSAPDLVPEEVQRMLSDLVVSKPNKALGSAGYAYIGRG